MMCSLLLDFKNILQQIPQAFLRYEQQVRFGTGEKWEQLLVQGQQEFEVADLGEAVQGDRRDLAVTRQILKVLQENIGGQCDQGRFVWTCFASNQLSISKRIRPGDQVGYLLESDFVDGAHEFDDSKGRFVYYDSKTPSLVDKKQEVIFQRQST